MGFLSYIVYGFERAKDMTTEKMNFGWIVILFLLGAGIFLMPGCFLFENGFADFEFENLGFPFQNPDHIERMSAFGIPGWSGAEPHNGIDLIIYESLSQSRILSPHRGTVQSIETSENPFSHPAGQLLLKINILINDTWTLSMVIEPGTTRTWPGYLTMSSNSSVGWL